MSLILKQALSTQLPYKVISRTFCCSGVLYTKKWRSQQGLPANRMSSGPLTDNPDYTFLDGRTTPLLHKQKLRMMKQREIAEKIVELHGELDFAVDREANILNAQAEERQKYISNKLKPKGVKLFKKSN